MLQDTAHYPKGFSGKKTLQHMLGLAQSIIPALVFSKLCYLDPFREATSDAVCVADQLKCSNDQRMKLCAVRSMTSSECCSIPASHARLHMLQSATGASNFASAMQAVHTLVPVAAHCQGREADPEGNLLPMVSSKHHQPSLCLLFLLRLLLLLRLLRLRRFNIRWHVCLRKVMMCNMSTH